MKTIALTISRGALIRNFLHSGVVSYLLDAGYKVVILTQYYDHPVFKEYAHERLTIFPIASSHEPARSGFMQELLKAAIFNKTVHNRYRYRVTGRPPSTLYYLFRMLFFVPISYFPGIKRIIRKIHNRIYPEKEYDQVLLQIKPDLVFSTAAGGDTGIIKSAKRLGIRTVDMPKSWDNLSKYLFPVKGDALIVWGEFMKEQAITYQGYRPEEVLITGGPQFDIYTRTDLLMTREAYAELLGLDAERKIILYGSTGGNCVDEVPYVEIISSAIDKGLIKDAQILVRPHVGYAGDRERFLSLIGNVHIIVDQTDQQDFRFKDKWDITTNHLRHLFNSLYHADVVINVASTLSLDAAACGTPAVNINFDAVPVNKHWSAKRLYGADYIDAIVKTGGTKIARSEEEFIQGIQSVLEEGKNGQSKAKREQMVRYFLHHIDGKSAARISSALQSLIPVE